MVKKEKEVEVTELDLIYDSHDRLDALIEVLVKKGVISREEYENKLEEIYERDLE